MAKAQTTAVKVAPYLMIRIGVFFEATPEQIDAMRRELRRNHGVQLHNKYSILREYVVRNLTPEAQKLLSTP